MKDTLNWDGTIWRIWDSGRYRTWTKKGVHYCVTEVSPWCYQATVKYPKRKPLKVGSPFPTAEACMAACRAHYQGNFSH